MDEMLIPLLAFLAVVGLGGGLLALRAVRGKPLQARLGDTTDDHASPSGTPGAKPRALGLIEGLGRKVSTGETSAGLRHELARAGYHTSYAAPLYLGAKTLLFFLGLIGLSILLLPVKMTVPIKATMILGGAAMVSFAPNIFLLQRRRKRRAEVRRHLPDALDLLEVSVTSGMGLDAAWNAVTDEIREVSVILANEMALTNLELHLGAPRAEAMRHMAERTGAEEVSSLVGVLVQSEKFGTSVADALRTFAESMRETRSTLAEVAAEQMAVKILFPMVVFIFPCILVVTVGPAVIIIIDMLG